MRCKKSPQQMLSQSISPQYKNGGSHMSINGNINNSHQLTYLKLLEEQSLQSFQKQTVNTILDSHPHSNRAHELSILRVKNLQLEQQLKSINARNDLLGLVGRSHEQLSHLPSHLDLDPASTMSLHINERDSFLSSTNTNKSPCLIGSQELGNGQAFNSLSSQLLHQTQVGSSLYPPTVQADRREERFMQTPLGIFGCINHRNLNSMSHGSHLPNFAAESNIRNHIMDSTRIEHMKGTTQLHQGLAVLGYDDYRSHNLRSFIHPTSAVLRPTNADVNNYIQGNIINNARSTLSFN